MPAFTQRPRCPRRPPSMWQEREAMHVTVYASQLNFWLVCICATIQSLSIIVIGMILGHTRCKHTATLVNKSPWTFSPPPPCRQIGHLYSAQPMARGPGWSWKWHVFWIHPEMFSFAREHFNSPWNLSKILIYLRILGNLWLVTKKHDLDKYKIKS